MPLTTATLSGGVSGHPTSWSITNAINTGWRANATLSGHHNTRFGKDTPVNFALADGRGSTLSAQLLANQRGRRWSPSGRSTAIELTDVATVRLAQGGLSFPTFRGGTLSAIVQAVASACNVQVSGVPSSAIWKEDVKLATGWDILRRAALANGRVLVVSTSGVVTFLGSTQMTGSSAFRPTDVEEAFRPADQAESIFVSVNRGMGQVSGPQHYDFTDIGNAKGQLHYPLGPGPNAIDDSRIGYLGWVGLWSGDPDAGGQLLRLWQLGGDGASVGEPISNDWPATHYSCIVYPNATSTTEPISARLTLIGYPANPVPAGIDAAIAETFGSGRGLSTTFSDSFISSAAFAAARYQDWLREANRGTDMVRARGALDLSAQVGASWSFGGLSGRIESVTHSGGGPSPTTEILVNCDM